MMVHGIYFLYSRLPLDRLKILQHQGEAFESTADLVHQLQESQEEPPLSLALPLQATGLALYAFNSR